MKPKVQQKLMEPFRCKYESRGDHSWDQMTNRSQNIHRKSDLSLKMKHTRILNLLTLCRNRLSSARISASPCCRTSRGNSEIFTSCSLTNFLMDEASSMFINPLITIASIRRSNSHKRVDLSTYTWER